MFNNKTVFLSCANKTGIPDLARAFYARKWSLYSAGNTAKKIRGEGVGITELNQMEHGIGDMLKHRLLTLCPAAHAPLLTTMTVEDDAELIGHGLPESYDIVISDLYSLGEATAKFEKGETTFPDLWESFDVGGPALLKSAIKGSKYTVVTPERRAELIDWIDGGCTDFIGHIVASNREAMCLVAERERAHDELMKRFPVEHQTMVEGRWKEALLK